jgi:hypothetical protein
MASSLPDPGLIVAFFSAALQTVQTWFQVRDSETARATFQRTFAAAQSSPEVILETRNLTALIPPDILEKMTNRVMQCWSDYEQVLGPHSLPGQIDRATEGVIACICAELHRIYRLNGSIPPGQLEKWWKAYCNRSR